MNVNATLPENDYLEFKANMSEFNPKSDDWDWSFAFPIIKVPQLIGSKKVYMNRWWRRQDINISTDEMNKICSIIKMHCGDIRSHEIRKFFKRCIGFSDDHFIDGFMN